MALQINLPDSPVGVPAPEAYARIVTLQFETATGKVTLRVAYHATSEAREASKRPLMEREYSGTIGVDFPNLDEALPNGIRTVAYQWLKTQEDFAGAIDV